MELLRKINDSGLSQVEKGQLIALCGSNSLCQAAVQTMNEPMDLELLRGMLPQGFTFFLLRFVFSCYFSCIFTLLLYC